MESGGRKGGGAKTTRSETVTVRLQPNVRYLAELAARAQRRTLSSYIEWAVEESFKSIVIDQEHDRRDESKLVDVPLSRQAVRLWDVHEPDRFAILASFHPHLLTHDEQKLWKLIQEVWSITQPAKDVEGPKKGFRLDLKDLELLRAHWQMFKDAAEGDIFPSDVAKAITGDKGVERGITVMSNINKEIKKRRKEQSETQGDNDG